MHSIQKKTSSLFVIKMKVRSTTQLFFLIAAFFLSGCPKAPDGPRYQGAGNITPQKGGTLIISREANIRGFDPHISFDAVSNVGIRLIFDGLLDYDEQANLIPKLAKSMPQTSEDGLIYTFHLRENVRFHNGRPLTAEDVRWSLEHMLDSKVGSPGFTFYTNILGLEDYRSGKTKHIQGIEIIDSHTLVLRLSQPDQTFLNAMAMTFAYPVPKENYEAHPTNVAFHPIGTGPFKLNPDNWERGVQAIFEKNPNYWDAELPYLDRIVLQENIGRDVSAMRFRNGDLDHLSGVSPTDYLFFKKAPKWQPYLSESPAATIFGITLNCELPPFDNKHVRRAVAFAINRARWSRARNHRLLPTGQPIPPGIMGYKKDLEGMQRYSLEQAKKEMELAGYPNGLEEKVTLWLGDGPTGRFYGELAQADLKQIGIQLRIKQVSFAVLIQETGKPKTAQMVLSGWSQDFPDPADFLDILFHSRAIHEHDSENRAFYRNPTLDKLLDEARIETNIEKRRTMYERASSIVAKDAPWALLWNDLDFHLWQPYVKNFKSHPVWGQSYRTMWLDLPKRKTTSLRATRFPNQIACSSLLHTMEENSQ